MSTFSITCFLDIGIWTAITVFDIVRKARKKNYVLDALGIIYSMSTWLFKSWFCSHPQAFTILSLSVAIVIVIASLVDISFHITVNNKRR
jgi:hypothetical protein